MAISYGDFLFWKIVFYYMQYIQELNDSKTNELDIGSSIIFLSWVPKGTFVEIRDLQGVEY